MSIGDTVVSEGIEYVVVWDGGPLLGPRDTKTAPDTVWNPPARIYKKDGVRYNKTKENAKNAD